MEIDQQQAWTHEQRLEEFARRQAKALETLTGYALAWSLAIGIVLLAGLVWFAVNL